MELILQMNAEEFIEVTKNGTLRHLPSHKTHSRRWGGRGAITGTSMDCATPSQLRHQRRHQCQRAPHLRGHQAGGATDDSTPQTTTEYLH